ncbi:MAG: hypothetical protein ACOYMS_07340 [Terrimicrobiaceae bacterium]
MFRASLRGFFAGIPLWAVLAAVLFAGCSRQKTDAPDVVILHSGRIRGNVYPLSLQSIAALQHYQYLAGYVRKVREEAARTGAKVLLIDLGDSLTGSFASHVTGSENMVTFFNDAGYDALLLSNLDYAVQPPTLAKLKAKVLNPFQDAAGKPATEGTVSGAKLQAGDMPVFLLANFYGDTSSSTFPDRFPAWFGTTATDVTPVRDYAKVLAGLGQQAGEGLTLLSWMKFESPKEPPEAFLQQLRGLGVNAILAHRIYGGKEKDVWTASGFYDWQPPVSLNILRNNGGFALARLDLKRDGKAWKVLKHQLIPMTANAAPADAAVVEAIARYAAPISQADTKLAELPASVPPEAILKIYMTALAGEPGTQAVLYSLQSVRTSWLAGELRSSQVFNSLPWTTPVVQLNLTAEQIAKVSRDLNLAVLRKDGPDAETLTVTTSEFFGRLIATKLGIPPDAIRPTAQKSEFDFFVEYLKAHPDAAGGADSSTGWSWSGKFQP